MSKSTFTGKRSWRGMEKLRRRQAHIASVREEARKRDEYRQVPGVSNLAPVAPDWWSHAPSRLAFIETADELFGAGS